jgi:hypothetical protein
MILVILVAYTGGMVLCSIQEQFDLYTDQKKTLCDHDGLAPVDVREELRWNIDPDGPAQGYPYIQAL